MQHTLVAVFDNRGDAQKAMDELLACGFSRQDVRLSEGEPTGATSSTTTSSAAREDEGIGASIKNFFSDIFGTDDSERAQLYSSAVTRGHHVLTLTASDEPEVERAADIVERHGPVDIDEHAAQWSGGAMAGGAMAGGATRPGAGIEQQAQAMSQQSPQGAPGSLQGGTMQGSTLQEGSIQRDTVQQKTMQPDMMQRDVVQGSQQRAEAASDTTAIPVIQEELKVGKREIQRGGVRIYQHMVETPVHESVALREEHVRVERHPVNQPVNPADLAAFQDKSIEMREMAEEAVVEKSARVVEEVVVGKTVSQREQQIDDTVRHTEVDVEQLAGSGVDDDSDYRSHWDTNYASSGGSYADVAPAYRYGSSMASNDQYRGRQWDEIEPTLRTDWESRYPDTAWEKIKAAVRHGWDKMTSYP